MHDSPSAGAIPIRKYLDAELIGEQRHEYVRGEVFAMTGGTLRHNRIALNIATRLKAAESSGACKTYMSDIKVRVADDVVYYPDVVVQSTPSDAGNVVLEHWRSADGQWSSDELAGTGSIDVSCPATQLTLDDIYADVELPPIGVAEPDMDDAGEYVTE